MNRLPDHKARVFADILDGYEATIVTANEGKRDTMDDIREALRGAGLKGSDLADELASFRDAVAERRLMQTNPEKAERKSKKRDGATDYLFVLTEKASRTHEGMKSAAETTVVAALAAGLVKHAIAGDADAQAVIAAAKSGSDVMCATASAILARDDKRPEQPKPPAQVHRTIRGASLKPESPLKSAPILPDTDDSCLDTDMPVFLRRAPQEGAAA